MSKSADGFTLIEVLTVIAIIAVLCALTVINLGHPQVTASLQGTADTLVADLKNQQLLAMAGDDGANGGGSPEPHGVVIAGDHYTLFAGATFSGADPHNFEIAPGGGISFTTTFAGNQVSFEPGSGEVDSFSATDNTITVHNSGDSKTITINRLGTVTVQ